MYKSLGRLVQGARLFDDNVLQSEITLRLMAATRNVSRDVCMRTTRSWCPWSCRYQSGLDRLRRRAAATERRRRLPGSRRAASSWKSTARRPHPRSTCKWSYSPDDSRLDSPYPDLDLERRTTSAEDASETVYSAVEQSRGRAATYSGGANIQTPSQDRTVWQRCMLKWDSLRPGEKMSLNGARLYDDPACKHWRY